MIHGNVSLKDGKLRMKPALTLQLEAIGRALFRLDILHQGPQRPATVEQCALDLLEPVGLELR